MLLYQFLSTESNAVLQTETHRCIYLDQPSTIHTEAYLQWVADGGVTESYVAPPAPPRSTPPQVPSSVSPRQIRQALTRAGLRVAVEAAVAAGDQDLNDWWEFSTNFERLNTQVQAMGTALGMTDLQLDDLWTLAGSL